MCVYAGCCPAKSKSSVKTPGQRRRPVQCFGKRHHALHGAEAATVRVESSYCTSQEDFWKVPPFKRALTFVFLARYVLGYQSQRMWKRFKMSDYKFNTRCFKRWDEKEGEIFSECKRFNDMPDTAPAPRKRTTATAESLSSTDSPYKRRFVVNDESTSEED